MNNLRLYGSRPFNVAVVHGGPGAPGEMAPVARELSKEYGVLEPLQTESTVERQQEELRNILEENGASSVILIGHSWGGMLVFILAARYPQLVKKLILVDSGVFEDKYAIDIMAIRLSRLTDEETITAQSLSRVLAGPSGKDKNSVFAELGKLIEKADSYDVLPKNGEVIEYQYDVFESVWAEAQDMRRNGQLLALGRNIRCPVVAIHGDYDPHPAAGVQIPLAEVLDDFRFILLRNCGHRPWMEKQAKDMFFETLFIELGG